MNKQFKLLMIRMPDEIYYAKPPSLKQAGFKLPSGIAVYSLTQGEAEQYAEEMKQAFIQHWKDEAAKPRSTSKIR